MRVARILFASDLNANYIQFWPVAARVWHYSTGAIPTLFFVAPENTPIERPEPCEIRYIDPKHFPGIPTDFLAQMIRLFGACWFPGDVCLISDIDLFVVKKSFLPNYIGNIPDSTFCVLNRYPSSMGRYSMCYQIGQGKLFAEILGMSPSPSWSVLAQKLKSIYTQNQGKWSSDEIFWTGVFSAWSQKNQGRFRIIFTPGLWGANTSQTVSHYHGFQYNRAKKEQYIEVEPPFPFLGKKAQIGNILNDLTPGLGVDFLQLPVQQSGIVRVNRHPFKNPAFQIRRPPRARFVRPVSTVPRASLKVVPIRRILPRKVRQTFIRRTRRVRNPRRVLAQ